MKLATYEIGGIYLSREYNTELTLLKYIVTKKEASFVEYEIYFGCYNTHKDIVKDWSIEEKQVIGGGTMNYKKEGKSIRLHGVSGSYGQVPPGILFGFEKALLKNKDIDVSDVSFSN